MKRRMESEQKSREEKCDPIKMETLRGRFVEQAKKYIGVPYAKRYHEPDCECISHHLHGMIHTHSVQ